MTPPIRMVPVDGQSFRSEQDWINRATRALTSHPDYNNTEHGEGEGWRGPHFTALCFDQAGRRMRNGGDFKRATEEGAYPVWWVWPDQIAAMLTAAPVREEGGAVDRAGLTAELHDYLIAARRKKSLTIPKDLGRRLLAALATREEASAEAGEPCEHQPGCDCTVAEEDVARSKPPLRAQPQAREDAQPVAFIGKDELASMKDGYQTVTATMWRKQISGTEPIYTTPPAPEAEKLRELDELISACEAEFCSDGTEGASFTYGEPDDAEVSYPKSSITFGHIRRARQALASLQQEGRA